MHPSRPVALRTAAGRVTALALLVAALSTAFVGCGSYHPEDGPYNLGVEALDEGKDAEALAHFKRSIELDPDDYRARFNLGVAYEALGNREAAAAAYEAVIAADPDNVPARLNLGSLAAEGGDPEAAKRWFREASEADTDDPRGPSALAQLALAANDLPAAKPQLEEALRRDPEHVASHYRLGRVHEAQGNDAAAIECYRRGLEADGDDPPTLARLGGLYLKQREFGPAIRYLELATVAAPARRRAWADLSRAYEGAGRLEDAVRAAWRARDLSEDVDDAKDRSRLQALYRRLLAETTPGGGAAPAGKPGG